MSRHASAARRIARRAAPYVALSAAAALALAACTSGGASPSAKAVASPSANPGAGATTLEGTAWQLTDYLGPQGTTVPVPPAVAATATFTAGTVAGNAGCNTYRGAYTLDGDKITIGQVAMTAMACPEPQMALEKAYTTALGAVATYSISGTTLELKTAEGKVGLRYAAATPPSLTKTSWVAVGINNGKGGVGGVVAGSEVTAIFGDDGTLTGNGGCNTYHGTYTADGAVMKIGPVASTKMACADEATSQQETNYFAALEKVTNYALKGDRLELRAADGSLQVDYTVAAP
jgi:heat shock protein HslJ